VSPHDQDFIADVEEREKAGTPGILQTLRAALAFEIKRAVSVPVIEARESGLLARAFEAWTGTPGIEILGNQDPSRRIGIVSFNLLDPRGGYLHPKFVTAVLNDLFGIQSRAGCSCAGPYGHRLLGIDACTSEDYRAWVRKGYQGIKPGWCRIGFHYSMDDVEADYVVDAVRLLARYGHRLLQLYRFDPVTGAWRHRDESERSPPFSLAAALQSGPLSSTALPGEQRARLFAGYLAEALRLVERLGEPTERPEAVLDGRFGELQFFST
jgi:hypothetical protein